MKSLSHRWPAKLIAWLLLAAAVTVLLCSAVGNRPLVRLRGNYDGGSYLRSELLSGVCARAAGNVYYSYYPAVKNNTVRVAYWQSFYSRQNSNFSFTLTDAQGEILLQNYTVEPSQYDFETSFTTQRPSSGPSTRLPHGRGRRRLSQQPQRLGVCGLAGHQSQQVALLYHLYAGAAAPGGDGCGRWAGRTGRGTGRTGGSRGRRRRAATPIILAAKRTSPAGRASRSAATVSTLRNTARSRWNSPSRRRFTAPRRSI